LSGPIDVSSARDTSTDICDDDPEVVAGMAQLQRIRDAEHGIPEIRPVRPVQ